MFRSSVSSRRFPSLAHLTSDDVDVIVMPSPADSRPKRRAKAAKAATSGGGAHLIDPELVKPSAVASLSSSKGGGSSKAAAPAAAVKQTKPAPAKRPPFKPNACSEARDGITVQKHGYVGMYSPFDQAHRQAIAEQQRAKALNISDRTFVPASASSAKAAVAINYYLNSPDSETLAAERAFIQERVARAVSDLNASGVGRASSKRK